MSDPAQKLRSRSRAATIEGAVALANGLLLAAIAVFLMFSRGTGAQVQPVVRTDAHTSRRIQQLEMQLERQPSHVDGALELSRLYARTGELSWSLGALQRAEQSDRTDPIWRMELGLSYLHIGRNLDGLRVLKGAMQRCAPPDCGAHVRARLEIFTRVAELLLERNIDSRKDQQAAANVLREVVKRVEGQVIEPGTGTHTGQSQP